MKRTVLLDVQFASEILILLINLKNFPDVNIYFILNVCTFGPRLKLNVRIVWLDTQTMIIEKKLCCISHNLN